MVKLAPQGTTCIIAAAKRPRAHGPKMVRVNAATAVMLEENTGTTVHIGQDARAMVLSAQRTRDACTTEKAHTQPGGTERGAHEGRKGLMEAGGGTGNGLARHSLLLRVRSREKMGSKKKASLQDTGNYINIKTYNYNSIFLCSNMHYNS